MLKILSSLCLVVAISYGQPIQDKSIDMRTLSGAGARGLGTAAGRVQKGVIGTNKGRRSTQEENKDEIIIISDGPETPNSSGSSANPLADLNANQLAALYLYTFGPWVAAGAIPGALLGGGLGGELGSLAGNGWNDPLLSALTELAGKGTGLLAGAGAGAAVGLAGFGSAHANVVAGRR